MKVYFAASIRGGRDKLEDYKTIAKIIQECGADLASTHLLEDAILHSENKLGPREVHDRDFRNLVSSDAVIAEVSIPSLGVGSEISDALHNKKPVLCIYDRKFDGKVSYYILGKPGIKIFSYDATEQGFAELRREIAGFLKALKTTT